MTDRGASRASLATALAAALARGDWPAARAHLHALDRLGPPHASIAYNEGLVLRRLERPAEAAAALERALALAPDHPHARFELGAARLEANEFGPAAEAFERHLARAPEDADAHLNLGRCRLAAGEPERALAPLERAHAALGTARSALALATARRDAGDVDGCRAILDALPATPEAAASRLKLLTQGPAGRLPLRAANLLGTQPPSASAPVASDPARSAPDEPAGSPSGEPTTFGDRDAR